MIKSECIRKTIKNNIIPPDDVIAALKLHDKELELIYNMHKNQWEIYRCKQKGVIDDEDVLCWQMSVPSHGTNITVGIVGWLKQFDTAFSGRLSADDLRNNWVKNVKSIFYNQDLRRQKELDETAGAWKELVHDFDVQKTGISVPKCVGYNTVRNKKIFAVKRKAVKIASVN